MLKKDFIVVKCLKIIQIKFITGEVWLNLAGVRSRENMVEVFQAKILEVLTQKFMEKQFVTI